MDMLISAYLYEHGNKIIYELDVSKRQLRTFKDNVYKMEEDLRDKLRSEYQNTIKRNLICIETTQRSFQDFKTDISTKIKADILQEQQLIEKTIKRKAFEYKKVKDKSDSKVTTSLYKHRDRLSLILASQYFIMNYKTVTDFIRSLTPFK